MTAATAAIMAIMITEIAVAMSEHCASARWPLLMILLALFIVVALCTRADPANAVNLDSFAKCLAEKKATMYGSFLCPHCDDQRKLFGPSFLYVPYVECSVPRSRQMTFPCIAAQIRYTPTWVFGDGERRVGVQSLKGLSEKTGCRLP